MSMTWSDLDPANAALLRSWPPIALLEGPKVAKVLGVESSTLRNWRHRGQGPSPEPSQRTRRGPRPVRYRVSEISAWLDGSGARPPWERERRWLVDHLEGWRFVDGAGFVDVEAEMTAQQTERVAIEVRLHSSDRLFAGAARIEAWPRL